MEKHLQFLRTTFPKRPKLQTSKLSTKTNHYMHKCSKENNPHCEYCGLTEDNLYLFTKYPRIQQIWTHYQPILTN